MLSKRFAVTPRAASLSLAILILTGAAPSPHRWRSGLAGVRASSSAPIAQFKFNGQLESTSKGKTAAVLDGKVLLDEGWLVLVKGSFRFTGKITRKNASATLPKKMRFQFVHKDKNGVKVLHTLKFDANVLTDGTIPAQSIPYNTFLQVAPGEIVEVSMTPVDHTLPPCTINVTVAVDPPSAPFPSRLPVREEVAGSPIQQIELTYGYYLLAAKKGQPFFHIWLNSPSGPMLTVSGSFYMKGQLTPDGPRAATLPTKLRVQIKHYDPEGTLLKTDTFNYKLSSSGAIQTKNFPFTTVNTDGVKETLDVSCIAVDKDMPEIDTSLTIGATATTSSGS